jgi:hexosaminidase
MKLKLLIILAVLFMACSKRARTEHELTLLPHPQKLEKGKSSICLNRGIKVIGKCFNQEYLHKVLQKNNVGEGNKVKVHFCRDTTISNDEAYKLKVTDNLIEITSKTKRGEFYALVTLSQLIKNGYIPEIIIEDEPKFSWRAFLLDEARHFQGKEVVKKLLDEMAYLKMNVFHWHLTDDQGWRIEIKKYPRLTEIGSKRDSTETKRNGPNGRVYDGKPHSGFYTQEDIKEIVAYAADRHITIMPEIGMPGHASAAIAAYPYLGTNKKEIKVPCRFGVGADVLDPSQFSTIEFLHDVLREVSELFPSKIIHIGGDEVRYDHWKKSRAVNQFKANYNLPTYSDVQVKFTNEISNFIEKELGKQAMGWNEILGIRTHDWASADAHAKTKLSQSAIIQFWHGTSEDFMEAITGGHCVVNSNGRQTYLDKSYGKISLLKAYQFNPIPEGLSEKYIDNIIGLGCQMWGEKTPTSERVYYQSFPRIAAYAETAWTVTEKKDYDRFVNNLRQLYDRWKSQGIEPAPWHMVTEKKD